MQTATTIIGIALIVMAVFLVIAVLMQSSKNHRMSGTIAGGAETFFGKTKGKSLDAMFSKLTTIVTIIFVILVVVLFVIQPEYDPSTLIPETNGDEVVEDVVDTNNAEAENTENADNAENAEVTENADQPEVNAEGQEENQTPEAAE